MIPTLLLVTTGARSGVRRQTPLVYVSNGDDIVVIASNFGSEHHPSWYHNLKAHPDAEVYVGGEHRLVHAREVHDDERDRLWERQRDAYRGYDTYVERAGDRTIPMMVLQRRA